MPVESGLQKEIEIRELWALEFNSHELKILFMIFSKKLDPL